MVVCYFWDCELGVMLSNNVVFVLMDGLEDSGKLVGFFWVFGVVLFHFFKFLNAR